MAGTRKKSTKTTGKGQTVAKTTEKSRMREEIKSLILLAIGAFLIFALFVSAAGKFGEIIQGFLLGVMGHIAYLLPFILIIYGILLLFKQTGLRGIRAILIMIFLFLMLMLLNSARFLDSAGGSVPEGTFGQIYTMSGLGESGGIIGVYVGGLLVSLIGKPGLYIFSIVILIILLILMINTPISKYFEALNTKRIERKARKLEERENEESQRLFEEKATEKVLQTGRVPKKQQNLEIDYGDDTSGFPEPKAGSTIGIQPVKSSAKSPFTKEEKLSKKQKNIMDLAKNDEIFGEQQEFDGLGLERSTDSNDKITDDVGSYGGKDKVDSVNNSSGFKAFTKDDDEFSDYKLPPINLLSKGPKSQKTNNSTELKMKAAKLEQTLTEFKVEAKVIKVTVGPTVTRYEVQPSVGVKINSFKILEQDLALNLEVKSVRVVPMSSGKVIGIEAYNEKTSLVNLREIIDSPEFKAEDSKIAFGLGKNISGKKIISDLRNMPHLLIAGTTGSGKSVCINSILLSILYRATPKEVQMILIDPKVVELKYYNGIPHLAMPVVTEADKAAIALEHAVREMNRRYNKFAEENVRNIESYNEIMELGSRNDEVMPEIVIVIDELADLMLIASQKVQDSISRLAAMARAAGMHLVVATQQPLASILTSVIKANIPSRIAFSVSSGSASRVILDNTGAERLLSKGDMLYHPVGSRESMRIQGSFVSESEVHKVTDYLKKQASPNYIPDILESIQAESTGKFVEDEDELYEDAVITVVSAQSASTSMLQRRFKIGYNRAARIMDMLESNGVVGPQDGGRPRKVLIKDEYSRPESSDHEPDEDNDDEDYYDE